jgi:hypothetical protein
VCPLTSGVTAPERILVCLNEGKQLSCGIWNFGKGVLTIDPEHTCKYLHLENSWSTGTRGSRNLVCTENFPSNQLQPNVNKNNELVNCMRDVSWTLVLDCAKSR